MRYLWLLFTVTTLSACTPEFKSFEVQSQRAISQDVELPLIPREVFFSYSERMRVRLSQDGKWVAFVMPIKNKEGKSEGLGIYRAPVGNQSQIEPVVVDNDPSFPEYFWTSDPNKIAFLRDTGGTENQQLYIADATTGELKNLIGNPEVKARFLGESPYQPGKMLFSQNDRDPRIFDLYVYDMNRGEKRLLYLNKEEFLGFMVDDQLKARMALKYDDDGNMDWFENVGGEWRLFKKVLFDDTIPTSMIGANWEKDLVYMVDSSARDKAVLKSINLRTSQEKILAESEHADITSILTTFDGSEVLAATYDYLKQELIPLNEEFAEELRQIRALHPGQKIQVDSRSRDDKTWMVTFMDDDSSTRYYIWNREARKATPSYVLQEQLDTLPLAEMNPVEITSRDGKTLVSYLTLPADVTYDPKTLRPSKPLPMVLYVHGGPWSRDEWGYSSTHQWLSNRGYAVLSVNFRGSTGFGKSFVSASYGEWGGKMHDDLIDAVNWAVENKIAPKDKIAIMGASYGGYATLAGLAFTPDVFAAGVDIVGVANLVTMAEASPPYWKPFRNASIRRMGGDHTTPEGRESLLSRSPVMFAENIRKPLLIGHGDNDPRVKLAEAQQITDRMVELGLPVTLVRFPDEGHGFARPENRQSFYGAVEVFLEKHLGGRSEPLELVPGTTINVTEGAEHVPGLPEALEELEEAN